MSRHHHFNRVGCHPPSLARSLRSPSSGSLSLPRALRTAPAGTPEAKLLSRHQPVLVFHPSEPFRPTKVQSFVEDSELEQFVGVSPAQLPLDAFWTVVDSDPEPGELQSPTPARSWADPAAG